MAKNKNWFADRLKDGVKVSNDKELDFYFLGIGISTYKHWENLHFPAKDVVQLRELLEEKYGFLPEHSEQIVNEEATYKRVTDTIYHLCQDATENDVLVIFFAGHGYFEDEFANTGYWVPYNAELRGEGTPESQFIPNGFLARCIRGSKAHHILLIVDSCFGGSVLMTQNRSGQPGSFQVASRYAITSGLLETVPDAGSFFRSLTEVLTENQSPYLSAPTLKEKIREKMEASEEGGEPGGGRLTAGDPGAIGEFHFVLSGAKGTSSPKKKTFFSVWRRLHFLVHFLSIIGIIGLVVLLTLGTNAPYWLRIVLSNGVTFGILAVFLLSGKKGLLLRGYGLVKRAPNDRTYILKRRLVVGLCMILSFNLVAVGEAIINYQTVELSLKSSFIAEYIGNNNEAVELQIVDLEGEVHAQTKIDRNSKYQIRLPAGRYYASLMVTSTTDVPASAYLDLKGGITPLIMPIP